ncbi:MAG: hypothetical protein IPK74_15570 [Deltaproteobacteria bacterium]|nr:hypothetical protein [Deltaproteobacteria bacterium]
MSADADPRPLQVVARAPGATPASPRGRSPASWLALLPASALAACLIDNPRWQAPAAGSSGASEDGGSDSGGLEPSPGCDALPPAPADAVALTPDDAATLPDRIESAAPDTTFVLAPGVYVLPRGLTITAAGVTLRGVGDDPTAVWLDGAGGSFDLVRIAADDVTIAELGLRATAGSLVVVEPSTSSITGTRLHRLVLRDAAAAQLRVDADASAGFFADDGEVACSDFGLGDAFRAEQVAACNVGAISMTATADWVVRDNLVQGFWCAEHNALPAVRVGFGARGTQIERNLFVDDWRPLVVGDSGPPDGSADGCLDATPPLRPFDDAQCGAQYWGHIGGGVRNNRVWTGGPGIATLANVDSGISMWCVCGGDVVHNTVVATLAVLSSIEYRYARSRLRLANNLVTHAIWARDPAAVQLGQSNATDVSLNLFVAALEPPPQLDLHLRVDATAARDVGVVLPAPAVLDDFELQPRDARPDYGADEYVP